MCTLHVTLFLEPLFTNQFWCVYGLNMIGDDVMMQYFECLYKLFIYVVEDPLG